MERIFLLTLCFLGVFSVDERCPQNFEMVSDSCFHFNNTHPMTWIKARERCEEMGGDLACLSDCHTFSLLTKYIYLNGLDLPEKWSYWVGGVENERGVWYWVDLSEMALGPPFWGSTNGVPEPNFHNNQTCAMLYRDDRYYMHDGECDKFAFFLCQIDPK